MASPAVKPPSPARPASPKAARVESIRTGVEPVGGWTKFPVHYEHLATMKKDADGKPQPMLSGLLQSNLIYWIGRKTYGSRERYEWARLSITDLAEICGGAERKNIATALADLIKRQIIAVPVREGCAANSPKMYKLCPQNWPKARPYKPEIDADLLELARQVEAGWRAAAQEPAAEKTSVVKPGRQSRPQPVAMPVKDGEPFMVRVVYHSEFDEPMAFRARAGANGRLQVTACRPANVVWGAKGSEGKANPCSRPRLHAEESFVANTELARYRVYINAILLELWETAKDENFIQTVFGAAKGAPLEVFQAHVALKFKSIQGPGVFHSEARKHQPGLLKGLAEDAARAFEARQQAEKRRTEEMPVVRAPKTPEPLDPARRWDRIRRELQKRLTPVSYENWFEATRQLEETGASTTVLVDGDQQTAEFLKEEYSAVLRDVCRELGEPALIRWKAGR